MSAQFQKTKTIPPKQFNLDSLATGVLLIIIEVSQTFSVPFGSPMAF
jgi:hypothetical protein